MKKLIFSLIAGVSLIAGTNVQTQACSGTITICASQWNKAVDDFERNCDALNDKIKWDIIGGC